MSETLTLLFQRREDGTFELQVREGWSGRTVTSSFVPPYTPKQLHALRKKLDNVERSEEELRIIGEHLFQALCCSPANSNDESGSYNALSGRPKNQGSYILSNSAPSSPLRSVALKGTITPDLKQRNTSEQSVQAVLRGVIQRTLRRRGTVALTFSFAPDCDELVSYPWELLHNGEHFLLASGIFTLTRALVRPDEPIGSALPVHPPFRMLYISASPHNCAPLETGKSFEALQHALAKLIETGQVFLDTLESATFDNLVEYFSLHGGTSNLEDSETKLPCYVVHFDGHGAYGRLCPNEGCGKLNVATARACVQCNTALGRVKAQTYLCFCDEQGYNSYIGTAALRDLFLSSDVRLAVFSACDTALFMGEHPGNIHRERSLRSAFQFSNSHQQHRRPAVDATLATALITAQVPAVVAMPFSLQDDLSPTFMLHFYGALAQGRTLEEALSRARHAMLPKHEAWFIPVLYRHISERHAEPVALFANRDAPDEHDHLFPHLEVPTTFVGRERELQEIGTLLAAAVDPRLIEGYSNRSEIKGMRPGMHHIAITGPAGIGKSAIAFEVARQNRNLFAGGIIGISLQGGRSFSDVLIDIGHHLHISTRNMDATDLRQRERLVLSLFRSLADRGMYCLLLLDSFEEIKEAHALELWYRFLCSLPPEVIVLVTSRGHPVPAAVIEGISCRWYEYQVGKMSDSDLLKLFADLASETGLDQRIHLDDPYQQEVLREICTLLDGYPLGAELIFGTTRLGGKVYTPEAATRSLEEVRDKLRDTPLAGIGAVLDVAYRSLTPPARRLLSYLAAFKLPFSREQIMMLVNSDELTSTPDAVSFKHDHLSNGDQSERQEIHPSPSGDVTPTLLAQNWSTARDELVTASFIIFDGRVYTIHSQVRNFALSYLQPEERRRVHRVAATYYSHLPQPSPDEWFAAIEHLEGAGEVQDLQQAVRLAVQASWTMEGRGHAHALLAMLRRAEVHALRLGDKTGEGQILCCLGAILRLLGRYAEAVGCLTRSLALHREQNEPNEEGWSLYELAMLCREEGDFRQAGEYAQEALNLFRTVTYAKGEAWMQMVLGEVSRGYGGYYDALGHFEIALHAFNNLHSDEGRAWVLRNIGTINEALGHYSKALTHYEEAFRLFNALGIRSGQAWVLADQSVVYTDQGKLDLAEQTCSKAIALFREQSMRRGEGWALRAIGDIARQRHNFGTARGYYEEAQAIFASLGDRVDEARVINSLGAIAFDEQEVFDAKEHYEHAQAIAHEQGARQVEGRALRGLGDVARDMHRFEESERHYRDALAIATDLDTPSERCAALRRLGELYAMRGRYRETIDCWVHALALDLRLGHPARKDQQDKVDVLVAEHHLEEAFAESCKKYGLG
jgi:tetratricopeptide (TPR) repeat protein